jgi:hypothetical protein
MNISSVEIFDLFYAGIAKEFQLLNCKGFSAEEKLFFFLP